MARRHRVGAALAIPFAALLAGAGAAFAERGAVDGGTGAESPDDEAAAPPTTALPVLPPLPGTTPPAPPTIATTAATTAAPAPPTVPVTTAPVTTGPAHQAAEGYVLATDTTGLLMIEVPATWSDVDPRGSVTDDGAVHAAIWAAPDLEEFGRTFTTPGLLLEAYPYSPDLRPVVDERLDFIPQACTDGGEIPYADGVFTGTLHTWNYCDGGNTRNFVLIASPDSMDMTILLYAQTVTPEDEAHVNQAFATFNVVPGIGLPTETVPPSTAPATVAPTAAPPTMAPPTVPGGGSTLPPPTAPSVGG